MAIAIQSLCNVSRLIHKAISKLFIKCSFAKDYFCQFILLFNLFLLLFMGSTTLFSTIHESYYTISTNIHESYCIISTNFYFYL